MSRRFLLALAGLMTSASLVGAWQAPTFLGQIHTVSLYATVVNKYKRVVPGLTKDDFEVLDNGKRQTLTAFKDDLQPITIVIMVDRSGSMLWPTELIKSASDQFIDDLLPADKARLGGFGRRIDLGPPEFTSDHDVLRTTFGEQSQDGGPTPLWNAASAAMDALANQKGRRALLILSDSKDNPDPADAKTALAAITTRAQVEDIVIYVVGLTGEIRTNGSAPLFQHGGGGRVRGGMGGRGTGGADLPAAWATSTPDPGLKKLALESGGDYFELTPTDGLASTFASIADDLHHPYALAFTAGKLDGKMHVLKINIRRAEITAHVRSGYLAAIN